MAVPPSGLPGRGLPALILLVAAPVFVAGPHRFGSSARGLVLVILGWQSESGPRARRETRDPRAKWSPDQCALPPPESQNPAGAGTSDRELETFAGPSPQACGMICLGPLEPFSFTPPPFSPQERSSAAFRGAWGGIQRPKPLQNPPQAGPDAKAVLSRLPRMGRLLRRPQDFKHHR